jgi:hypothetical protein
MQMHNIDVFQADFKLLWYGYLSAVILPKADYQTGDLLFHYEVLGNVRTNRRIGSRIGYVIDCHPAILESHCLVHLEEINNQTCN